MQWFKYVQVFTKIVFRYITMQVAIPPLLLSWIKIIFFRTHLETMSNFLYLLIIYIFGLEAYLHFSLINSITNWASCFTQIQWKMPIKSFIDFFKQKIRSRVILFENLLRNFHKDKLIIQGRSMYLIFFSLHCGLLLRMVVAVMQC